MKNRVPTTAALLWLLLVPQGVPGREGRADEPPIAGQPQDFSGAVGSYRIAMAAQPTELQAEDPLILTVRITGSGPAQHHPRRPDLRKRAAFARRFHIENLPDAPSQPQPGVWEFQYRLKPLRPDVREIPALRFDYYKPGTIPREKGYRATYARAIPLRLLPRAEVTAEDVQGPLPAQPIPDRLYQITRGPETVLQRQSVGAFPTVALLAILLVAPPLLCAIGYAAWRYFYPDAARRARRQQSRAAREALAAIRATEDKRLDDPGRTVAEIMTAYLRRRLDFSAAEPTPAEVAVLLAERGAGPDLVGRAGAFFQACDAARFGPEQPDGRDHLHASARDLILVLEAHSWPSSF
jgi:hypothetical protein